MDVCLPFPFSQGEFKVQKEACWAISNIVIGGSPQQRAYLLNIGALNAMGKLLSVSDVKVLSLLLDTIKKIFEVTSS